MLAKRLQRRCEVISWPRFHTLARRLARQIHDSGYRPDIIVAIGRGGYVPARVLSDFLGLMDLVSFRIEHYRNARKQPAARVRFPLNVDLTARRVLLVDDVSDSGDTFAVALEHLRGCGAPAQIRTAVIFHKQICPYVPDYYAGRILKWRWIIYPWAVAEDVGSLLRAMRPKPADAVEASQRLGLEHGIRLPRNVISDMLELAG